MADIVKTQSQSVATRVTDPNQSLAKMLNDAMPELRKVAPKYVNLTRMVSLAIEAKMRNQLLEKCSPVSVLNFCKRCAEAGTDRIGAGGMWAVPFWNKKTSAYDMLPMPDWRLIIEKAKKAKAITHATAEAVYENDVFDYERGLTPSLTHKPALSNRGKLKAVYCVYVLPDGTKDFAVMDIAEDVEPIHKRSKAADAGPWVTDYAEMAKKTVVKRAMKTFEGASIELTALISADNIASGYIDAEVIAPRAPVAMPVEIPQEATPEPQAATEAEHQGPPSAQAPVAENPPADKPAGQTITGVVSKLSEKPTKNGGKKYGVCLATNEGEQWANTFDAKLHDAAKELRGKMVTAFVTQGPYGLDLDGINEIESEPGDAKE